MITVVVELDRQRARSCIDSNPVGPTSRAGMRWWSWLLEQDPIWSKWRKWMATRCSSSRMVQRTTARMFHFHRRAASGQRFRGTERKSFPSIMRRSIRASKPLEKDKAPRSQFPCLCYNSWSMDRGLACLLHCCSVRHHWDQAREPYTPTSRGCSRNLCKYPRRLLPSGCLWRRTVR